MTDADDLRADPESSLLGNWMVSMTNRDRIAPSRGFPARAAILCALAGIVGTVQAGELPKLDSNFQPIPGVRQFSGQLIVRPHPGTIIDWQTQFPGVQIVSRVAETGEWIIRVPLRGQDAKIASNMVATGLVEYAEPDWIVFPTGTPNDGLYGSQWHHPKIASPGAWDIWTGTSQITVAVVDSGIALNHPEFAQRLVGGYNAVTKLTQAAGGDVSDVANSSHGTAVAGLVGATGNNSIGVTGIGWNFKIMPVRATNEPSGSAVLSVVLAGCRWASDNGAKVVNASYAGVSSSSVQSTGAYVRDRNSILVWSSGNTGSNLGASVDWPDVIIVGATDQNDARPTWGNYGTALDIVAPGTSILTTIKPNTYGTHEGTSFSAPIVSGVLGLAWSVDPTLTRAEVIDSVLNSAVDLGGVGEDDQFGRGRVDVKQSVLAAWRKAHVFVAPITSIDQLGSLNSVMWPVRPARGVKSVHFGDDLHAPALATYNGDVLESAGFDTSTLHIDRAQLRISTFQTGSAELVTEYYSADGLWLPLIDSASTITGPFEHAWLLPPDAIHREFAVRFTTVAPNSDPLYLSSMTVSDRCGADFDDSGFVDTDDFTSFVKAFEQGSASADVDFSGFVDTDDFTRFVTWFDEGC